MPNYKNLTANLRRKILEFWIDLYYFIIKDALF
jgi:hypothetical protein